MNLAIIDACFPILKSHRCRKTHDLEYDKWTLSTWHIVYTLQYIQSIFEVKLDFLQRITK